MHRIYILPDFTRAFTGCDQCVAGARGHLEANQNCVLIGISASPAVGLIPQTFEILTVLRNEILGASDADPAISSQLVEFFLAHRPMKDFIAVVNENG
ncbi:hypothetical protein [Streptomyces microflavus]|uniref:hypothetical protein n=1 Tax=Streptomyces microflavus TaxID=1919 RepID=UPI0033EDC709